MITIVLYSPLQEEIRHIRQLVSAYSIRHSWADCHVDVVADTGKLAQIQLADILISDVSEPGATDALKTVRARCPAALVFPIAGPEVPPTLYVCPQIMPCGLFWRPMGLETARPVIEQMMSAIHDQAVPRSQSSFRISGKQKTQDIPYSKIIFFEARDKKLVLRLREQELTFSGTLSQLTEQLPPEFIRCHKSFLVNREHIVSVDRSSDMIDLDDGSALPISRGCKKSFWEVYRDGVGSEPGADRGAAAALS